jgi:hypothetical protein
MALGYNYLEQSVIASLTIAEKDDDSFFSPVLWQHTGFAFDGNYYDQGLLVAGTQASWFTEPVTAQRGNSAAFPDNVLVVLSVASLSMLNTSNDTISLWMLFYYMDTGAFPNNFTSGIASFSPQSLAWGNGRLSVVSAADPGSPFNGPYAVLTFDFVADQVYMDYALIP